VLYAKKGLNVRRFRKLAIGLTTSLALAGISIAAAPSASAQAPPGQSPAQRVVAELGAVPHLLSSTASANTGMPTASPVSIEPNGSRGTTTHPTGSLSVTPDALPHVDAA
jgi:hypothetical protein